MTAPPRLLGVFAHPDDETFCTGGTFAKYAEAGAEIMVLSATRGEAGQIRDSRVATRRTLPQVREAELRLACKRLGVEHVQCLDHVDGRLCEADPERLVGEIVRAIRSFRPDVVVTFGPDGGYGHPDHIRISEATTRACLDAAVPARFPEHRAEGFGPHSQVRLYHSYFPPRGVRLRNRLVDWLVDQRTRFAGDAEFVHALLLMAEDASTLRYTSDHSDVEWFPTRSYVIEQGEAATRLYLILSGHADVLHEHADGRTEHLARLGPGEFFGERGIADEGARNAHVVAATGLTCLVFSPAEPTRFAGRGVDARLVDDPSGPAGGVEETLEATTRIDVSGHIDAKVAALSAYRSQFPLEPGLLPDSILREMFGCEYFVQVLPPPALDTELL